jgi:hypothetical protein
MPNALGDSNGKMPSFLSNGNFTSDASFSPKEGHKNITAKETSQPAAEEIPKPWVSQRCTDQARPLKVIYIGAGISGICGAIEFKKQVPDLELVIYEKNPELGGTWYENR